jgi:hypothetical protein
MDQNLKNNSFTKPLTTQPVESLTEKHPWLRIHTLKDDLLAAQKDLKKQTSENMPGVSAAAHISAQIPLAQKSNISNNIPVDPPTPEFSNFSKNFQPQKKPEGTERDELVKLALNILETQKVPKSTEKTPINILQTDIDVQKVPQPISPNPFKHPGDETQEENRQKNTTTLKRVTSPIHTFTTDVASSVKNEHTSVIKIAAAENERKIRQEKQKIKEGSLNTAGKNVFTIVISLLLLMAATGIGYYILFIHQPTTKPVVTNTTTDILGAEKQTTISLTEVNHSQLLQTLQNIIGSNILSNGQVEHIAMTDTNGQITTPSAAADLFALLQTNAPNSLIRSLNNNFYFGIYNMNGINQPFLILSSNSYSDTIAGMLEWEKDMVKDLQNIFLAPSDQLVPPFFTETASNTQYSFTDAVISNKDARIVRNGQGDQGQNVVFLYSMINQNTLIITTNQTIFQALLDRLIKTTFIR